MESEGMRGAGRGRPTSVRCASCRQVVATLAPGETLVNGTEGVERTVSCSCGTTQAIRVARRTG